MLRQLHSSSRLARGLASFSSGRSRFRSSVGGSLRFGGGCGYGYGTADGAVQLVDGTVNHLGAGRADAGRALEGVAEIGDLVERGGGESHARTGGFRRHG